MLNIPAAINGNRPRWIKYSKLTNPPTMERYQNATGNTLRCFFSEAHHCTTNRLKKTNCPTKPNTSHQSNRTNGVVITFVMYSWKSIPTLSFDIKRRWIIQTIDDKRALCVKFFHGFS